MAQKSVIGWIIKKFKRCVAIVEDGDTASRAIAKGKYVMWKGNPYSASSAISSGDTLSLSNLTAKPDGFVNDLNSNMPTTSSDSTVSIFKCYKYGKVVCVHCTGDGHKESSGTWATIGTLPIGYRPQTLIYFDAHDNLGDRSMAGRIYTNGEIQVYFYAGITMQPIFSVTFIIS